MVEGLKFTLEWMGVHPVLTVILFLIVFEAIEAPFRRRK
jgi:hypothetical protein